MQLQLGISLSANMGIPTELLGLCFVDQKSTKLTSNKASIHLVARHSGAIQDTSLKTGQWRSWAHASRALKSLKLARARYAIKRRLKRINALFQNRQEQRWHAILLKRLSEQIPPHGSQEEGVFCQEPPPLFPKQAVSPGLFY